MDSCHGYQIRRRLGFGGGGIVFSGLRKSDNLRVAIKIIKRKGSEENHQTIPEVSWHLGSLPP